MANNESVIDEIEIAAQAVKALSEAQRRAEKSGLGVVIVKDNELVRVGPLGKTVLKKLPPRKKVAERIKRAAP